MELQNLERDVQTLRKLYGLLRFNRNGSQCACSECYLDESSKIFFENLLDGATEMVFEAYSKFTSAQFGVFDAPPATELEKLKGMPILRPPFSPDMSKISHGVAQSSCPTQFVVSDLPSAILQRKLIGKIGTSQTSKLTSSLGSMGLINKKIQVVDSGHKLSGTQAIDTTRREKGVPNQMITWTTMPAQKPSQYMLSTTLFGSLMDQKNGGIQKSSKWVAQRKKILPCQQESIARSSSSSWTSQEASSHTYCQGDMSSTSSSDSGGYSLSDMTVNPYMCPTSSRESEGYPLPDQVQACHHMDLSSLVASSPSTSVGSANDSRSSHQVRLKKQRGGFRRLKDKLALVFNHHYHHHHHHHHHGDGDHRDQKTKAGRDTSLWKNAGKIFHGKSKDEAYGEQAADKHRKSVVCKVADKNQHVHFHKLVKGILGQVRQSRKSKVLKGDIKRLGGSRRGGKKAVKKLPWWKLLRLQKAKKNWSKPCVKVGFGSKNPMFKTLPKMR